MERTIGGTADRPEDVFLLYKYADAFNWKIGTMEIVPASPESTRLTNAIPIVFVHSLFFYGIVLYLQWIRFRNGSSVEQDERRDCVIGDMILWSTTVCPK